MPGTAIAWDADRMREVLSRTLRRAGKQPWRIHDCRVERLRHRPGKRSVVLYLVDLEDPRTGKRGCRWLAGTIYRGDRGRALYRRLRRAERDRSEGLPTASGPPFLWLIPELNMLVQSFPHDRHLPALATLVHGPAPELEHDLLRHFGEGRWCLVSCAVETIRYRPSIGATVRWRLTAVERKSGNECTRDFFVKLFRDQRGAAVYSKQSALRAVFERGKYGVRAANPVSYHPELEALVLEGAPGKPLVDALTDPSGNRLAAERSAQALAALHRGEFPGKLVAESAFSGQEIRREAAFLSWACPDLEESLFHLVSQLERRLGRGPRACAHMDLKPDHLFLDERDVWLIDLDDFGFSDPVADVAMLAARLDTLGDVNVVSGPGGRCLADALLETYFSAVPDHWQNAFGVNYARGLLKASVYCVQHLVEDWPVLARQFVADATLAVTGGNARARRRICSN